MLNKDHLLEKIKDFFMYHPQARLLAFITILSLILSVAVNINLSRPYKTYKLGEFADRNIKASQSLEFEDVEATEKVARESEKVIPPTFDYDPGTLNSIKQRVHEAFKNLRKNPSVADARKKFEDHIGRTVDDSSYKVIAHDSFSWRMERALLYILGAVPDRYIIDDKELISEEGSGEITINDVSKGENVGSYRESSKRLKTSELLQLIVTLDEVRQMMKERAKDIFNKFNKGEQTAIMNMSGSLVKANLTFNKDKTVRTRQGARERVNKVIVKVSKGEIIVRDGEPIEKRQIMILNQLRMASLSYQNVIFYAFYFMLFSLVFYSLSFYTRSSTYIYKPKTKDLVVLGLFVLCYALGFKLWLFISSILAGYIVDIPLDVFLVLFPYVTMVFVVRILFTTEFAAMLTIAAAVIIGVMTEGNFIFSGYVLCSGFVASSLVMRFEERSTLVKAGLWVGLFQMLFAAVMIVAKIYTINFSWHHVIYAAIGGFFSGILSAFVSEAVVPVFEYIFSYTTNLKLLEFANTNHPLLRDFLIKAPGTYNHSMIVAQLAAVGADEIGGNSLLARVGSYYHDIGKMGKAVYFIENQQGAINPHDKLNPTMSARILVSHVKDGVKMARECKLGKPIVDIIEQHHGTSLMKFFYAKALEQNKEANELDYRYPGPKPKSREAVLVMIADSCEAACRTLEDPTPSRIKNTVDNIINNIFVDGQFDECNITLKRLKVISQIYTKILIALHHNRIEYPDLHQTEEQNGNYTDRRSWDKHTQKIIDKDGKESPVDSKL